MKSLVHTEELCSRSVPLEHAPGAKPLVCIGLKDFVHSGSLGLIQGTHARYVINNFCHSVTLAWFSIQILVNSKIFKLLLYLSLMHLRAQITCYELKGVLSPVMLNKIFHDSFENFEITRICMKNHASVTGWQKLFFSNKCFQLSAAVAIAAFEIYG